MKLSIAWIFDHIKANWKEIDIEQLVAQFSASSAEIESVRHISLDLDNFSLAMVKSITSKGITVESVELKKTFILPERKDVAIDDIYLIRKEKRAYYWASLGDIGSEKEGLLTRIWCSVE